MFVISVIIGGKGMVFIIGININSFFYYDEGYFAVYGTDVFVVFLN